MIASATTTSSETRLIPLSRLAAQQNAVVVEICNTCPHMCNRLAMMGLAPGACVQMLLCGRTCLLKAGRTRFSMRCSDLDSIMVECLA